MNQMLTIEVIESIQARLEYSFKDSQWLLQALTHKSYVNEMREGLHNEKLEFIGDAVIDLVLAEEMFQIFPNDTEGDLSKKRASLVNEIRLSEIAAPLDLFKHVRRGRGEIQKAESPRLVSSTLEALIGAIFFDGGYSSAREFVLRIFGPSLKDKDLLLNFSQDFKSRLQEEAQRDHRDTPVYELLHEQGAAHERLFTVQVKVKGQVLAMGQGRSKKEAEQMAAQQALSKEKL